MRSFNEAAKPLYQLIGLFVISTSWAYFSPNEIHKVDPRVFFMITGTIFSNFSVSFHFIDWKTSENSILCLQCRLIVAQMSDTICDGWNLQLTVYSIATVICIFPYQLCGLSVLPLSIERGILITLLVLFSVLHFHYGYGIVTEMCEHFGIKCFTVCWSFYRTAWRYYCTHNRYLPLSCRLNPNQRQKMSMKTWVCSWWRSENLWW